MKRTNNQDEYATNGNQRFSILPAKAIADNRVSSAQLRTLAALGVFGDKDGWCWPSLGRLAAMVHKSRQAVSKDIQALASLGYIEIHARYDDADGRRLVNRVRIMFDTHQLQLDTSKDLVDTPSTNLVDTPSTNLVDVNAPINAPIERIKRGAKTAPRNDGTTEPKPVPLCESATYLLSCLGGKRLNPKQKETMQSLEAQYGLEEVKGLVDWAAKNGLTIARAPAAIEAALQKHSRGGKPGKPMVIRIDPVRGY